jgi:raffinose/stachyose/melibiose transport system substrate-binding protein
MHTAPLRTLAAVSICLAVAACTGQTIDTGSDGQSREGPQTIKWLIEEPEDAEALRALKDHIATFEKESGNTVQVQTLPFENMKTVLQTQLRSGEGPDVFNWGSGPDFGGKLAEAGLLYDLSDAYRKHGWEVYDFAKERVTVDGKVYGIPGEMETLGVFYNKEIFDKAGVAAPQSVDELMNAAEQLQQAGYIPMAVGDKEAWEGGHYLSMSLSSIVGSDGMEALISGKKPWDSPEVVEALRIWKDMQEAGYLTRSPTAVDYDTSVAQFLSGEAAMLPTGSWLVGEIEDNTDFDVGYIPFPGPNGEGVFASGLGSGPYISASTDKVDASIEFLDFLASEEHARWTVENLHTIPPVPMDTESLNVSPLLKKVVSDVEEMSQGGDFGYNIDVMVSPAVNEAMYEGVQGVFTDQATPAEAAASMEEGSAG